MKRLLGLLAVLLLALTSVASAQDDSYTDDLAAMARYAPADTVIFAAARTDDAYIETLDGLINRFADLMDEDFPGLVAAIDEGLAEQGLTFAENIRPWLGDTASLAMQGVTGRRQSGVVAVQVTDRAMLEGYLELLLAEAENTEYTRSEGEGYALWTPEDDDESTLLLADDVLLIGADGGDVEAAFAGGDTLADSADFNAAVGALPAPSYNILSYVNTPELQSLAQGMATMATDGELNAALLGAVGPVAVGFTLLDGVLTIDSASLPGDTDALTEAGLLPSTDAQPVNAEWAQYIPANASLVILDTGLGSDATVLLNAVALAADINAEVSEDEDAPNGDQVRALLNIFFRGSTGLDFEEDFLPAAQGGYGAYLTVEADDDAGALISGAFVMTNPGADISAGLVTALTDSLDTEDIDYTVEGNVVTVPGALRTAVSEDIDVEAIPADYLTGVVGYNDDVFVAGSLPAAAYSLNPTGDSLATSAAFQNAQAIWLPDAETVWFVDVGSLAAVAETAVDLAEDPEEAARGVELVQRFESATITSLITADQVTLTRATLTLAGE